MGSIWPGNVGNVTRSIHSTLASKNLKLFTRNKEKVSSEIKNFVILVSVLILLSFTIKRSKMEEHAAPPRLLSSLPIVRSTCARIMVLAHRVTRVLYILEIRLPALAAQTI
jgi:hypothetical protein